MQFRTTTAIQVVIICSGTKKHFCSLHSVCAGHRSWDTLPFPHPPLAHCHLVSALLSVDRFCQNRVFHKVSAWGTWKLLTLLYYLPTYLPTYLPNNSTEQNPRLLWNRKVHYHVHKSPPFVPVLSQMHSVHIFPPYFPKNHSNIIFPSMSRSSSRLFPSGFTTKILYAFFNFPMSCPSHSPRVHHPNNTW